MQIATISVTLGIEASNEKSMYLKTCSIDCLLLSFDL